MAKNIHFSHFKESGAINIRFHRRIAHSLSNRWRAMNKKEVTMEVVEQGTFVAGTISASCTVAAVATSGAFVIAASGPIAAGALGVVGLILAAKSTYSNREAAHKALTPYVWSYLDNDRPDVITDNNKKAVGAAALSLILDGQSQQNIGGDKFQSKLGKYNAFIKKYSQVSRAHALYQQGFKGEKFILAVYHSEVDRQKLLEKEFKSGGAAFEFARRAVHYGNYLQAYTVFGKILQKDEDQLIDFSSSIDEVRTTRKNFAELSAHIQSHDEAFAAVDKIIRTG